MREAKYSSVRFFRVSLHEPQLGLEDAEYQSLSSEVDIIIHNTWQVNFALPLQTFQQQLQGVCNLVDWSLQSPRRPRLVFCSSVSSVMDWPIKNHSSPIIPEDRIVDQSNSLQTGYGISKSTAEQILSISSIRGADVNIVRFGQIVQSGDFSGEKNRMDHAWVPALFQTSKTLGCFPIDICDIDWLSLDEASAAFLELSIQDLSSFDGSTGRLRMYNAVNHSSSSWADVLPQLAEADLAPNSAVSLTA